MNAAELEQEQLDIEDEMNEEDDDSDSDSELLIQALRDRIRAAAYLQALGQKLPFGLHFGLIHTLPLAQEALRKVHEDDMKKVGSGARGGAPILLPFSCSEKNCGAKFTNWSLLNTHLNSHRLALRDDQVKVRTFQDVVVIVVLIDHIVDFDKLNLVKLGYGGLV